MPQIVMKFNTGVANDVPPPQLDESIAIGKEFKTERPNSPRVPMMKIDYFKNIDNQSSKNVLGRSHDMALGPGSVSGKSQNLKLANIDNYMVRLSKLKAEQKGKAEKRDKKVSASHDFVLGLSQERSQSAMLTHPKNKKG